jgi:hypothetical protein
VEKTVIIDSELAELRDRAQRAIDDARILVKDFQFLCAWRRMRPKAGHRLNPSTMLGD